MTIKINSSGEDVKKIQLKLGITADGVFGSGTESAVKEWQAANGLVADGIVGNVSLKLMFPEESNATESSTPIANVGDLKLDNLKGHIPDIVIAQIPDSVETFHINTRLRLAHFLAQCAHESGDFRFTEENLNYSASGLKRVFRKYFQGNLANQAAELFDAFWRGDRSWLLKTNNHATNVFISNQTRLCRHRLACIYNDLIGNAKQQICLTTPYFVPSHRIQNALLEAVKRGVNVHLLVPRTSGLPRFH
jgi:hypothetical protein